MPLQTSGQISLSQIQTQYGGANNLSISEYYNGGPNSTPNVSTSRISKIIMKGVSGTTDGNADIREFEFDGLGDWGTGDRRTGNNEITISTNMKTISDPNSNTEPPLNAWINGSKELDTPDSRYLVGQVTINSDYYIEFEFVGSATKPLVNDFNKLKIYWDKSDISQDADMGTWEIMVYNEDGMELSYGNITLTESNIVSTGSGSSNSEVWQYFTSTYISGGEALRSTEYFSPQDIDQNPTKLAEKTSNSISSGYLGFIWANPAPNHGVPAGAVSFDFVRTNEANTITQTYNRQGSMNNYDGNKRHMFVHIANATAAGVYQTKSYATFKNADGSNYTSTGGSSSTTVHYLEFNLGTPSSIASGGYVSGVSYIPTYSQPYTEIKFSDFYYQEPVSSGPPNPPNESPNRGFSGGLGDTGLEIITGLYANNTSRTEGTTSFDNRGVVGRDSSNNVPYMNLIIQAKPGDVLNLIGRINTGGTYIEYCEFWVWLGSWSRFASPNASFLGNRDFSVNYTIPSNTVAGPYALAVACSYYTLGSSSYRSWKSYSLEVWT